MLRLSFLDSKTNRNCFQHFTWLIAWLINMRMIYFSTCFCHFYNNFFWWIRNWLIFENQKYFLVQNYKCILVIFFYSRFSCTSYNHKDAWEILCFHHDGYWTKMVYIWIHLIISRTILCNCYHWWFMQNSGKKNNEVL